MTGENEVQFTTLYNLGAYYNNDLKEAGILFKKDDMKACGQIKTENKTKAVEACSLAIIDTENFSSRSMEKTT